MVNKKNTPTMELAKALRKHVWKDEKHSNSDFFAFETDIEDVVLKTEVSVEVEVNIDGYEARGFVEQAREDNEDDIFLAAAENMVTSIIDELDSPDISINLWTYEADTGMTSVKDEISLVKVATKRG